MALAQATVALAEQAPARARSFVEREPNTNADRALRHLLVAWAAWLEGKRDEADGELTRALALLPDLAAAHLLSGHLSREMGDLEGAQRGYRQALRHSPGHEIAAAALAATLLERDAASTEAEELLGKLGRSPVGQSWRQLLLAERAFRNGEQGSVLGELRAAVSAAPLDPALLFHGVQVLTAAGDYDRARTTLTDRLRKTRASDQDTALFLLEADLEIAQGFELRAVERLRERAPVPRGQRTLALALILLGQYGEAPEVLTGDSSEDARLLRLAAEAATGRKGALLALRDGSRTSRLAKLGLVVALIAQRQPADALPVARELASCPWYRYRALTLMAEAQHLGGDLSAAVASLDAVLRDGASPGFMGARELLGRIYVQTARYEEAAKTLTTVWEKGRRSRDVALALASARALSGKPAEASAMLREAKRLGASAEALDAAAAIIRLAEGKLEDIPDDGDVTYLLALGAARLRTGDSAQAERAWRRALEADPSNPLPYLELGKLHAARRKATALGFFERAIARFKKKPYFPAAVTVEAQLGTARYLLSAGRAGEAIALVKTAMSSETARTAPAYRLLGECHLAQRRYDEARAALERCAGLDVEDATAFYLLGTAARAKPKRARQALQRFLQLEPKGKRAAAARRALRHLP
jgi:tetratricopeptide (TPR) repeat protein